MERLAAALRSSGIHVQVRTDMERWIRTHAGWMCPFMLTAALAPAAFGVLARVPVGVLTFVARQVLRSAALRTHVTAAGAHVEGEGRLLAADLLASGELPALRCSDGPEGTCLQGP